MIPFAAAAIVLTLVAAAGLVVLLDRWRRLRIASQTVLKVQNERQARSRAELRLTAAEAKATQLEQEVKSLRHELGRWDEVQRVRAVVDEHLPLDASVVVVSRGDDELLALGSRPAGHFPQDETGRYCGYHPASSSQAIALLEAVRARGAQFLVFPGSAFWWLDHYPELAAHLACYKPVADHEDSCLIFDLNAAPPTPGAENAVARP